MFKSTETVRTHKVRTRTTVKEGGKVKTTERVRVEREATRTTVRRKPGRKPQGVILYRGPSLLDGSPLVCVAVGLARGSKNRKTGLGAVQVYILADNGQDPVQANKSGGDK